MRRLLLQLLLLCCLLPLSAQTPNFQLLDADQLVDAATTSISVQVDVAQLSEQVRKAPLEFQGLKTTTEITLPLPNGTFADFRVYNSPLLENHPELGSYKLHGPWGSGRMSVSPMGVTVMAKGPTGYFLVAPDQDRPTEHRVARVSDYLTQMATAEMRELSCGHTAEEMNNISFPEEEIALAANKSANDPQSLLMYDMLLTCPGEFGRRFGNSTAAIQGVFNDAMNIINAIYENDLGIRLNTLDIPGLIYLDPDTDPYTNNANAAELTEQLQAALDSNGIANDAYDIAHILFNCNGSLLGFGPGLACNPDQTPPPGGNLDRRKNQGGASCLTRDRFVANVISTMAHEIGHQFTGNHTWSNCGGPGEAAGFAVEPGGGNTIMAYGAICGNQTFSEIDPYFHSISVQQINNFVRFSVGATCATEVETDNLSPTVTIDYEEGFVIPVSTPFRLEGQATDTNNDALTYTWEQFDTDLSFSPLGAPEGNAPIFRSAVPSPEGWERYFPQLSLIVQNRDIREERLPTYSRDLTFRLTARDNNQEAGATDWQQVSFRADEAAGPFVVNNPDTSSWHVGDYTEVTWDVANTNLAPVNSKRVDILLSTDGGETFDVVLAEDAANIGSAFITVPDLPETTEARIMVMAADNVFLNVNADDFSILPATVPGFTLEPDLRFADVCLSGGDIVTVTLNSSSLLGFDTLITLSVEDADFPDGLVTSFSDEEITPGASSTLTVDLSGVTVSDTLELVVRATTTTDTTRRTIRLEVTADDYSDLVLTTPAEGTAGVILTTPFDWTASVNADLYDIEIATSPTFAEGTLFDQASDLTDPSFLPEDFFENNTLYFWRVRGSNRCGTGAWSAPQSFRTINSACNDFAYTGNPIGLPGSGPSFVRESAIFIEQSGTISDVNLPNVNIQYNFASKVTITLVSPAGTRVELYKENCFSTNRIDLGFDDDAPVAVACPPDDRRVFTPTGSLADLIGEETLGEWLLEVAVSETGGSAGSIQSWEIEFCADIASTPPQTINNTATEVPPLQRNVILKDKLNVTSEAFRTNFVQYTLTDLPDAGRLILYGEELMVGDNFFQADINGLGLFYENTDDDFETDDFGFLVTTPDGGYLPITYHDIIITEDAVVSNREVSTLDASLLAFPNPVGDVLNIRWGTAPNRMLNLELYDLNGRLLQQKTVAGLTQAASLDLTVLPTGVYLLRVDGAVRRIVKR